MCPVDLYVGLTLLAQIDNVIADGLALSIAIGPNHQVVDVSAVGYQILHHLLRAFNWDLFQRDLVERLHVSGLPALAVVRVLEPHNVAQD